MEYQEAKQILAREAAQYHCWSVEQFRRLPAVEDTSTVRSQSGREYLFVAQALEYEESGLTNFEVPFTVMESKRGWFAPSVSTDVTLGEADIWDG